MTEEEFLALNSVYLKKIATGRAVAQATGLPEAVVGEVLAGAESESAGAVVDVGGGMLMLSEDGVRAVLGGYEARYADCRVDPAVEDWYQRFETLNKQFLEGVTAWQQDVGDMAKMDRLLKLVERQIRALASISERIPRYEAYAGRFSHAIDQVDTGATNYLVSPDVDSIHNIWFEFHEDILTVLGRPRDVAESAG